MKIKTKRDDEEFQEIKYLKILNSDGAEFKITENKFGEIVINKYHDENMTIIIQPMTTNEILIK